MGQVTINSKLGNYIYKTCRSNAKIKNVVDIGTWDGRGTTECVIRGLIDSGRQNLSLISLETNKQFHDMAVMSWNLSGLPEWAKLIHGRLVDRENLDTENLTESEIGWMEQDIKGYSECPNVVSMLPNCIDLVVLDGGEFSTKAEFILLEHRTSMFVLDDTQSRKCRWIREYALSNQSKYQILFDDLSDPLRGIMAFVKA